MAMAAAQADVFISGAGPAGLILAYHLLKLGISVYIVDAADKESPSFPMYGRACGLVPRTREMLDQLDLLDELEQAGALIEADFSYSNGKRVWRGGWSLQDIKGKTFFDSMLAIRLKYSEDIFRARLAKMGLKVQAPVKLIGFSLDEQATDDDYKVHVKCTDSRGEPIAIKVKYIVGCDGGGSTVRKLGGIPFTGERKVDHFVRIDGMVKTNLPESRGGAGGFNSKTHGHVLFSIIDHGATRIGYTLTEKLFNKYGLKMKAEDALAEAKIAVAPFELDMPKIDWHTVYGVQQHLAESLFAQDRILLAGDAGHTHSSANAQGMNAGIHDVVSLSWRLAGVLNRVYKPDVLTNYSDERLASAQHLIANDKVASSLMFGKIPENMKNGTATQDPAVLLDEFGKQQASFFLGLSVSYAPNNLLNDLEGAYPPLAIRPGYRAPDFVVRKPGLSLPVRLFEQAFKYNGKYRILVFAGSKPDTDASLKALRSQVDAASGKYDLAIDFITIVAGYGVGFYEYLGFSQFGNGYWDVDHSGHKAYNVHITAGALVVVRPDGIFATVRPLDRFDEVEVYLQRMVLPQAQKKLTTNGHATNNGVGEFLTPDENNLPTGNKEHLMEFN